MVQSVEYKKDLTKSNQLKIDSDTKEKIYCDDDGEYRIHCHICDKLAIDRSHNSHLKSQTLIKNFRRRQQFKNTNCSTSSQY